jgi:acyl carrier protein
VYDEGFKVVLTGEGADEVFGGYDIFKEAKLRRFCARDPQSAVRPLLFRRLYPYLPKLQAQSAAYLKAFFATDLDAVNDPLFSHLPRFRSTAGAKLFYSDELKSELAGYDAIDDLRACLPADFARWHPLSQAQYLETAYLLPGYILSSQGDRMAMAHSVEGRFPFLDHRVVEAAARIPPRLKLRGLTEKYVLRQAARDLLPTRMAERPKQITARRTAPRSSALRSPDTSRALSPDRRSPRRVSSTAARWISLRRKARPGASTASATTRRWSGFCRRSSGGRRLSAMREHANRNTLSRRLPKESKNMDAELLARVRGFIEENFLFREDISDLAEDESLLESGVMDSTGVLELVAFIETEFSVQMADAEIIPDNLDSIAAIAGYLERKRAHQAAA